MVAELVERRNSHGTSEPLAMGQSYAADCDGISREGRIGPNAITRVAEAILTRHGQRTVNDVFAAAGLSHYLARPPVEMVCEGDVIRLHHALYANLERDDAGEISRLAGRLTADYLLANRIPRAVQILLYWLPARVGMKFLMAAIARNAWTFTGSGQFDVMTWSPLEFAITNCPLCRPPAKAMRACRYYGATFERLLRVLSHPQIEVVTTACCAEGAEHCAFRTHIAPIGEAPAGD